jgi:OOP family OmpA-OmpF porin
MKARTILQFMVLYVVANAAVAQPVANDGYARDLSADVVKSPFGLCWRTSQWTETKAIDGCDATPRKVRAEAVGVPAAVVPQLAEPKLVEAPRPAPVVVVPVAPVPVPVAMRRQAITLGADASFDTGKAELKPEGQAKLDDLASKLRGLEFDSIRVIGHTDNVGGDAANQRLSQRRADAVKAYLAKRGVQASKIKASGAGKSKPIADNKTAQGKARNRRVEVEINGTRML